MFTGENVMKWFALAITAALSVSGAWAAENMKAGLWEIHVIKQTMDGHDMTQQMAAAQAQMQEQMAKMSPAQRKQMEQMMGKQANATPNVHRICVSREMAARDKPMVSADSKCEPTKYSRSGNKVTFEMNCAPDHGRKMTGKGESINSGDTITSRMDMVMTDDKGQHTMQTESQMKFLGTDCQGVKPVDHIAK